MWFPVSSPSLKSDNRCVRCCRRFCWMCQPGCPHRNEHFNETRAKDFSFERHKSKENHGKTFQSVFMPDVEFQTHD